MFNTNPVTQLFYLALALKLSCKNWKNKQYIIARENRNAANRCIRLLLDPCTAIFLKNKEEYLSGYILIHFLSNR